MRSRGFTLIEVIIATTLLGTLLAMLLSANSSLFDRGADDATVNMRDQRSQNIRNILLSMSNGTQRDAYLAALGGTSDHIVVEYLVTPEFPWSNKFLFGSRIVTASDVTLDDAVSMSNYLKTQQLGHFGNDVVAEKSSRNTLDASGQIHPFFFQMDDIVTDPKNVGLLLWVLQSPGDGSGTKHCPALLWVHSVDANNLAVVLFARMTIVSNTVEDLMAIQGSLSTAMSNVLASPTVALGFSAPTRVSPIQFAYGVTYNSTSKRSYRKDTPPATFSLLSSVVPMYNTSNGSGSTYRVTLPHPYDVDAVTVQATRILTGAPIITPQNLYVDFANSFIIQGISR